VGGAAQIPAMKKIAGPLRIELAQYRELAAFAQFGSDLSKDTLDRLKHGERIVEVLKQAQYDPMPVELQVILLYALTHRYFKAVNIENVQRTERDFLAFITEQNAPLAAEVKAKGAISAELEEKIKAAAESFVKNYR
jgi:F-type H+-transporting ATPase subunit alpha